MQNFQCSEWCFEESSDDGLVEGDGTSKRQAYFKPWEALDEAFDIFLYDSIAFISLA